VKQSHHILAKGDPATGTLPGIEFTVKPPKARAVYGPAFSTIIYQFDYEKRMGRLALLRPDKVVEWTDWFTRGVASIDLEFPSVEAVYYWLLAFISQHSGYPEPIFDIIVREDITVKEKINVLLPYLTGSAAYAMPDKLLGAEWDGATKVTLHFIVIAGIPAILLVFIPVLIKAVKVLIIAGAIAGAIALIGYAVSWAVTTVKHALGIGAVTPEEREAWEPFVHQVRITAEQGRKAVKDQRRIALETLDKLLAEGKITKDAYDALKAEILAMEHVALTAIKDVEDTAVEEIEKTYQSALGRGRMEGGLVGGAIGALGGGIAGWMVGKRS